MLLRNNLVIVWLLKIQNVRLTISHYSFPLRFFSEPAASFISVFNLIIGTIVLCNLWFHNETISSVVPGLEKSTSLLVITNRIAFLILKLLLSLTQISALYLHINCQFLWLSFIQNVRMSFYHLTLLCFMNLFLNFTIFVILIRLL